MIRMMLNVVLNYIVVEFQNIDACSRI